MLEMKGLDISPNRLVMEALDVNLTQLYELLNTELSREQLQKIDMCILASKNSIPLSRVTGKKQFWKDAFHVSPYTLDPRPETEGIIECAVKLCQPGSILDLGTGTGCVLLSLLREFPNANGIGVDITNLDTARLNSDKLGISRANFIESNWYGNVVGTFDLIVSNPPYVKTQCAYEALFDPPLSLWASDAYEHIITAKHLAPNGLMILEVPDYSLQDIEIRAARNGLSVIYKHILPRIFIVVLAHV